MQLSGKKTWSQQVLAAKLHLHAPQKSTFLNFERRALLILSIKTAMAAGICYWLATLAHLQDGYWGSISAIIVMQSNVGSTVTASRDRLIGTLIGAAFGAVFSLLGEGLWAYLLAVVTAMVACSLLGLKNSSRLAAVTVTILMLVHRSGSNWILPMHRVLEVLLGIVVALAISTLVLPDRAKVRLRDGLSQQFLLMAAFFQAVIDGFRGNPSPHLERLRKDVETSAQANEQLLQAARNEPSSAKVSLESLSLLHQFGLSLKALLHALELAVKNKDGASGEDSYAAHLEPELGRLSGNVHIGFQYVAGCIHRWQFNLPPSDFVLEDDIAALEAKMEAIRPTVFDFPQSEILRAYAVQLHLKQLAHMLRTTRIETNRAIGTE